MTPRPLPTGRSSRAQRRIPRLLATVAVAVGIVGGLCAVGATPSSAAGNRPGFTWSSAHAVPGASTNTADAPAIGGICYISGEGTPSGPCGTTVMWRNAATNVVDYKVAATSNLKTWDATASVPSARTSTTPAFTNYYDIYLNYGPFVAWKGQGANQQVWYSGDTISWSPQKTIPGATTTTAPAVFLPYYLYTLFVTWTGTNGDVYYSWGNPNVVKGVDTFTWTKPAAIPGASTNAAPTVAEVTTSPNEGRMYVYWKGTTDDEIWYSSIADPYLGATWSAPKAMTSGSPRTSAGPAASPFGSGIMVAYRGQSGGGVWYEQMTSAGSWGAQHQLAGATTTADPGLADGALADTQSGGGINAYTF